MHCVAATNLPYFIVLTSVLTNDQFIGWLGIKRLTVFDAHRSIVKFSIIVRASLDI